MKYELSVLFTLAAGGTVVHVLSIHADQTIAWVKAHADEIATKHFGGNNYCALLVTEPTGVN